MIKRLITIFSRLHKQCHLLTHTGLTNVISQAERAYGAINVLFTLTRSGGNQAISFNHKLQLSQIMWLNYAMPFNARRIKSSLLKPSCATALTARLASAGLKPKLISALTASFSGLCASVTAETPAGSMLFCPANGVLSQFLKRSLSSTSKRSAVFLPTPGTFIKRLVSSAFTH